MSVDSIPTPSLSLPKRWKTYLMERSPPGALLVITAGISLAPMAMRRQFDPLLWIFGVIVGYGLLVQMRLGDELKDLDKDRKIHPERPLPRGLLEVSQVTNAMLLVIGLTLSLGAALILAHHAFSGALLILSTVFAWLMFKEFFIGASLAREPMLYALTHQIIVFAVYGWIGAYYGRSFFANSQFQAWLVGNFSASFTFEICRKLDPNAAAEAGTYLHNYGAKLTAIFAAAFVALSIVAGARSGNAAWLLPAQIPMLLVLLLIPLKPEKFKSVEGMAILFASWLLWYPSVQWMVAALKHRGMM